MKLREWYAVHGRNAVIPSPDAMLDSIRPRVAGLVHDFPIANGSWREGAFRVEHAALPLILATRALPGDESFSWDGEGWEAELREWTVKREVVAHSHCDSVIGHLRDTRQTIYLVPIEFTVGHKRLARICEQVCGCLARTTDGLIHVFAAGFFDAEGQSLFPYQPKHRLQTS